VLSATPRGRALLTGSVITSVGTLVAWAAPSLPATGTGPGRGGATGVESGFQGWLDPGMPWPVVISALMAICFLSAAVSMHAWAGTRKHHDIRSIGR
jgi:hypothetical protein